MPTEINVTVALSTADLDRIAERVAELLAPMIAPPMFKVSASVEIEAIGDPPPVSDNERRAIKAQDFASGFHPGAPFEGLPPPPSISDEAMADIVRASRVDDCFDVIRPSKAPYNSAEAKCARKAGRAFDGSATSAVMGDPQPGRSALDRRNGAGA